MDSKSVKHRGVIYNLIIMSPSSTGVEMTMGQRPVFLPTLVLQVGLVKVWNGRGTKQNEQGRFKGF